MIFHHHDLTIELDASWWAEAQMAGFVPNGQAYRVDLPAAKGQAVFEARIDEIGPVRRNPGVGIFHKNEIKIRYKLTAGTHRLYCSIAAGFSRVPAVEGLDITAPYI